MPLGGAAAAASTSCRATDAVAPSPNWRSPLPGTSRKRLPPAPGVPPRCEPVRALSWARRPLEMTTISSASWACPQARCIVAILPPTNTTRTATARAAGDSVAVRDSARRDLNRMRRALSMRAGSDSERGRRGLCFILRPRRPAFVADVADVGNQVAQSSPIRLPPTATVRRQQRPTAIAAFTASDRWRRALQKSDLAARNSLSTNVPRTKAYECVSL